MKTMIYSDYKTVRSILLQLLVIALIIASILAIPFGDVVASTAMVVAIIDLGAVMNLCAYDDTSDWQRFRLTLPLSRTQVVLGRYASVVLIMIGSAVVAAIIGFVLQMTLSTLGVEGFTLEPLSLMLPEMAIAVMVATCLALLAVAVALPFIMRFGMTKATRFIMVAMVLLYVLGLQGFSSVNSGGMALESLLTSLAGSAASNEALLGSLVGLAGGALLVACVVYVVSAFVAIRLYKTRQF